MRAISITYVIQLLKPQAFEIAKFVTLHSVAFANIHTLNQRETGIRGLMWR
jgi:hypothetical protein